MDLSYSLYSVLLDPVDSSWCSLANHRSEPGSCTNTAYILSISSTYTLLIGSLLRRLTEACIGSRIGSLSCTRMSYRILSNRGPIGMGSRQRQGRAKWDSSGVLWGRQPHGESKDMDAPGSINFVPCKRLCQARSVNSLRESVLWGVVAPKLKGICIFFK